MDLQVDERDFELLGRDKYTFAVMDRILRSECELVLTDHEKLILCHSARMYPVWVWTPDGADEALKEAAWRLIAGYRPPREGFRYNVKYELAAYLIARACAEGLEMDYATRLCAYDCPRPVSPEAQADGRPHLCTEEDEAEAAALVPGFYSEIGEEVPSYESCLEKVREYIRNKAFFFWKNAEGQTVACCSYRANGDLASLGSVYTLPGYRRRRYAINLVYHVTRTVKEQGFTPMLYTDADYPASNACYKKIGYRSRGELCTVAAKTRETA